MKNFDFIFSLLRKRFFFLINIIIFNLLTFYYGFIFFNSHNTIESDQFFSIFTPLVVLFFLFLFIYLIQKLKKIKSNSIFKKYYRLLGGIIKKINQSNTSLLIFLSPFHFSRYIEKKNPQFMNSLGCALEIISSKKKKNIFEKRVIDESESLLVKLKKKIFKKIFFLFFFIKKQF